MLRHHKKVLIPLAQILLLLAAVSCWLVHRDKAYYQEFSAEDLAAPQSSVISGTASVDASASSGGVFLSLSPLSLAPGTYQVLVNYAADSGGSSLLASTSQLSTLEFRSSAVALDPALSSAVLTMDLSRAASDIRIDLSFSGAGSISIFSILVVGASDHYKRAIFYALLLCCLIGLAARFFRLDTAGQKTTLALAGIFLAVCYPLYTDYLTVGHDIPFHLLRIEGIAEGLRAGMFPVKVHPLWANGYGYAVGVLYGDILLYFPAVLRLLGFSVQAAYKIFLASINLATVVSSYFCFKRMFSSRKAGLLGSLLYSASLYRLIDVYTRAAVGEYSAMLFFPLALCGFYLIFMESGSKSWPRYAVLTAAGLTGLIQSHVLSCEMATFVVLLLCLLCIRKVFRPQILKALALAFVLTVLLNLNFLVPFLDYYQSDLYITSDVWNGNRTGSLQACGIFPIQLFSLFQHSCGGAWNTQAGVSSEFTVGIGIVYLAGCLLFGYLTLFHRKECKSSKNFIPACMCAGLGCLLMFMSTCFFPWDALTSLGEAAEALLSPLQFPWRLLAPATALLTFSVCYAVSEMFRSIDRTAASLTLAGMLVLLTINIGWYMYDFCFSQQPYRVYSTAELDTMAMYSYEYLPAAVDPAQIVANRILPANAELSDYQKSGLTIQAHVAAGPDAYIDFPLNYYKHYICTASSGHKALPVSAGENGMVRVAFPSGFEDDIKITFQEPWFWRVAEIVSLAALLACGGIVLSGCRRPR